MSCQVKFKSIPVIILPYIRCGFGGLNKYDVKKVFKVFCDSDYSCNAWLILCEFVV